MRAMSRRHLLIAVGLAAIGGAGVFAATWFNVSARNDGAGRLSPPDAHLAALAGEILLIDIRRPDEWSRTGLPEGAHPLDMRRADFFQALAALAGETNRPIVLICARGVRSRRTGAALVQAGFKNVMDVPEGMSGSGAGPGWLARNLPVVQWSG